MKTDTPLYKTLAGLILWSISTLSLATKPEAFPVPTTIAVIPVFSQVVSLAIPQPFVSVFEHTKNGHYINEFIPKNQTISHWTEMLTVTGTEHLADNEKATPIGYANQIAAGYHNACPTTFSTETMGALKMGQYDAFVAHVSCGTAPQPKTVQKVKPFSEEMLFIVVKGEHDFYTIQWTTRGSASKKPLTLDKETLSQIMSQRLRQLAPMKLCANLKGEKNPYESCMKAGF